MTANSEIVEALPVPAAEVSDDSVASPNTWRRRVVLGLVWAGIVLWIGLSVVGGWRVRRWTYDSFDPMRFHSDVQRRAMWGMDATGPEGFLNQYEKMAVERPEWGIFLDYSPLRLLVVREWGSYLRRHFPGVAAVPAARAYDVVLPREMRSSGSAEALERSWEVQFPVLAFGAGLDLMGAVAAFFLTRIWVRRTTRASSSFWLGRHLHGTWQGLIAATLLWFNPNVLLNGYGWPTWDTWVAPMFLLAALLASLDLWFVSGVALAVGMMLKGQQLAIAPIFPIWALIVGGPRPALRWVIGMTLGAAVIVSPWMITYLPAEQLHAARMIQASMPVSEWPATLFVIARAVDGWAIGWIVCAAVAAWAAMRFRNVRWHVAVAAGGVFILAYWPWLLARNRGLWLNGIFCAAIAAACAAWLPRRGQRYMIAGIIGCGLLLCMSVFHGSTAWWLCGFRFPQLQAPFLIWGPASNMPAIFELRFNWPREIDAIAFTMPALQAFAHGWMARHGVWPGVPMAVSSGAMFDGVYFVLLILSGVGIGMHARRRDSRFLVALVTPWLLFFLLPVRLHERYLLFAAATASICIGHGLGMTLLGILLTVASSVMTLDQMWKDVGRWGRELSVQFPWLFTPTSGFTIRHYVENTHPDIGWGILVAGMVFFYLTVMPGRGRRDVQHNSI